MTSKARLDREEAKMLADIAKMRDDRNALLAACEDLLPLAIEGVGRCLNDADNEGEARSWNADYNRRIANARAAVNAARSR